MVKPGQFHAKCNYDLNFAVAKRDKWCWKVPKDTGDAGYRTLNPIGELINDDSDNHVTDSFKAYSEHHNKKFKNELDLRKRMHIFRHNLR